MSKLGAAVNIVTSDGPAGKVGITASSVCSVTDSPPILLACINQRSSAHDAILNNGVICVNTLGNWHEALSRKFAGGLAMPERFAGSDWTLLATGSPVLEDALVSFDCKVIDTVCQGTHRVLFCQVHEMRLNDSGPIGGLIYFERRYHEVHA